MKRTFKFIGIGLGLAAILVAAWLVIPGLIREGSMTWLKANALKVLTLNPEISDAGDTQPLVDAINNSLRYLQSQPSSKRFIYGGDSFAKARIINSLEDFKAKLAVWGLSPAFFTYVREHFTFYRSSADSVLFTGYFESTLYGSRQKTHRYAFPLYRTPPGLLEIDLKRFSFYKNIASPPRSVRARIGDKGKIIPYFSRDEIDYQGALNGQNLEIAWIDNPIDVFFLHIQGSGIVLQEDGEHFRVSFAEKNGHPYRAIGQYLLDTGALKPGNISMQSIRHYLETHPERRKEIFNYNPSYVFFREVDEGPAGCLGVSVTGMRSIATDRSLMPEAGLCYVETQMPELNEDGGIKTWREFRGFLLNQDTGGAITSPGRVDIFTGNGKTAEAIAGYMQQTGMFYFLVKKEP